MKQFFSLERIAPKARQTAAEGCVLLENKNETLPLRQGDRVALFGRIAFDYYKSGLGSGGLVNAAYVVGIDSALKAEAAITLDQGLLDVYETWRTENPYDVGKGWGQVPWSQKEMPVSEELVQQTAQRNDIAVVVIGRTAGEDQDIRVEAGSYLLSDTEKELIATVCRHFPRTAVLLNVGSIIDMSWVLEFNVPAVMYVWQGGQEGGNGVADVLTGRVNPSGRLTDTIAASIEDYPSTRNFGDPARNVYQEDIYVGYRYFETFAPEKVLYPFGFGLSYTRFETAASIQAGEGSLTVCTNVCNIGSRAGSTAVLAYVEAPQGKLGKPSRALIGFGKTKVLNPGESETVTMEIPEYRFASFDDSGVTGYPNAYVLETGTYNVYVGGDVRSAALAGSFQNELTLVCQCEEALAPVEPFQRMRPDGWEPAPLRTIDPQVRRMERMPAEIPQTGDRGWKLADVHSGAVSLDDFVGQLSDDEMMQLFRGEGMCSPKVTPGTASAFGGLSPALRSFGIPAGCCSDGPSGIRMDCGTRAFSLPNGTLLGCTFNVPLVESLYTETGLELRKNRIDTLLGPGMNIHRSPLNGRNFEYISEDPLVTGLNAAAQLRGLNASGATGTIKHFCGNNQEFKRHDAEDVVSQRALREIYLKGFEYAVKEGPCRSIMTTYGPINGVWTAGQYDLNTTILRREWGFKGIVMTDWWAKSNWEGRPAGENVRAPMVAAQNDLFMVTRDATDNSQDDLASALAEGKITRAELQRSAQNILTFLLHSIAMEYELGTITQEELDANEPEADDISAARMHYCDADPVTGVVQIDSADWNLSRGSSEVCAVHVGPWGEYTVTMTMSTKLGELAQLPISIYLDNVLQGTISIQGTNGAAVTRSMPIGPVFGHNHYLKFYFAADGLEIKDIRLECVRAMQL